MSAMQPLKAEHQHLLPHIEHLRTVADAVGETATQEFQTAVAEGHRFLTEHLLPHAEAEEAWLYPAVGRAMGAAMATDTMSRDHVEVGRLVAELGELRLRIADGYDRDLANALRCVLYGLYALIRVHFQKEEEVYVPLLEQRLAAGEARDLLEAMGTLHAHE